MSFFPHPYEWFEQICAAKQKFSLRCRPVEAAEGLQAVNASSWLICRPSLLSNIGKTCMKEMVALPPNNKRCVIGSFVLAKALPWGMKRNLSHWAIKYLNLWCPGRCTVGFLNQPAFEFWGPLWTALRLFQCQQHMLLPLPGSSVECCVLSSELWLVGWQTEEWLGSKIGSV